MAQWNSVQRSSRSLLELAWSHYYAAYHNYSHSQMQILDDGSQLFFHLQYCSLGAAHYHRSSLSLDIVRANQFLWTQTCLHGVQRGCSWYNGSKLLDLLFKVALKMAKYLPHFNVSNCLLLMANDCFSYVLFSNGWDHFALPWSWIDSQEDER